MKNIFQIVCSLVVVGVLAGLSAGTVNAITTAPSFIPPTAQRDRIGIYHWTSDTSVKPAQLDKLTWGVNAATGLGTRTIRVALTTQDSYGVNNGATTLATIAQQPAYQALFANPRLSTYVLTVYSSADLWANWSDGYSVEEKQAVYNETYALAAYLLQNYQNKKFIFLNWEGDNVLQGVASSDIVAWSGYTDWMNARVSGVADARTATTGSTSQVYSGLEFNAVKRLDNGAPCDVTHNKCVISYVAPQVPADYYSYSAWQSLDPSAVNTQSVGSRLSADLTTAHNYLVAARPVTTPANFIVGEFGTARDITGECVAASRTQKAIEALESWGASYGIFWQAMDNDPINNELFLGYGAYKRNGSISLSGKTLRNLYSTGVATVPSATCATIGNGGIVNGRTFTPSIRRGDVISIFGSNFSSSGNTVWIKQNGKFYSVKAGSPWWHESPGQINATLPIGVVAGEKVSVYVARADGLDSNAQLITVLP